MTYFIENGPRTRHTGSAIPVIAALIFGVLAGAYATSGVWNVPALQSEELVIPGEDWHGNVRRSDR